MLIRPGSNIAFGFPLAGPQAQPSDTGEGGAYVAKAVHFSGDGGYITIPVSGLPDTGKLTVLTWLAHSGTTTPPSAPEGAGDDVHVFGSYPNGYVLLPATLLNIGGGFDSSAMMGFFSDDSGSRYMVRTDTQDVPIINWTHYAISVDLEHDDPGKIEQFYVNGSPVTFDQSGGGYASSTHDSSAIIIPFSAETQFSIDHYAYATPGAYDIADPMMWIGQQIDLVAHIGKFIAGGKPVDPSVAIAAFGQPQFLFSGDSSTFAVNQGSAGAATLTGSLTNATTSPSD